MLSCKPSRLTKAPPFRRIFCPERNRGRDRKSHFNAGPAGTVLQNELISFGTRPQDDSLQTDRANNTLISHTMQLGNRSEQRFSFAG